MYRDCVWAVSCLSPAAACRSSRCVYVWHLSGFWVNTADCAEVQGTDKARHHRACLDKAVRASMLVRFAWCGEVNEERYGTSVYYTQGHELKVDAERQSHFLECEQPSPCASFCRMCGSVFWLAGNCALCLS